MTDYEEIINSGKLYRVAELTGCDPQFFTYLQRMETYNALGYTPEAEREKKKLLKELFAEIGEGSYVQAPYHAMWGGRHTHIGKGVYINFNCTLVDDAQIYIGDGTMIAPNVTIVAASYPVSPRLRAEGYGCNKPVHIGKNVWIAANATILQGVRIGDNSIIGAASVVTKDVPENVIVMGSPAKIFREITPEDEVYYDHGKLIAGNKITEYRPTEKGGA